MFPPTLPFCNPALQELTDTLGLLRVMYVPGNKRFVKRFDKIFASDAPVRVGISLLLNRQTFRYLGLEKKLNVYLDSKTYHKLRTFEIHRCVFGSNHNQGN